MIPFPPWSDSGAVHSSEERTLRDGLERSITSCRDFVGVGDVGLEIEGTFGVVLLDFSLSSPGIQYVEYLGFRLP